MQRIMWAYRSKIILRSIFKHYKEIEKTSCRQNSNIVRSPFTNVEVPNSPLPDFIFESFGKFPNEIAVECCLTGKNYTFDEIRIKSHNFNTNLRNKLKLKKSDIVAVILPNLPDFPICVLGAMQAGLIVTNINPRFTAGEISCQLQNINVKAIITLSGLYNVAKHATNIAKLDIPVLIVKLQQADSIPNGAIDINEFIQMKCDIEDVKSIASEDVAMLPFTSGTTGKSKGVELTHKNIITHLCQINHEDVRHTPVTSKIHKNTFLGILPWCHAYGITIGLFYNLYEHSKIVAVPQFTSDVFVNLLAKYKPNILHVVPSLLVSMSASVKPELFDPVQVILSAAAPLSKKDEEYFLNNVNKKVNILQAYGMTEGLVMLFETIKGKKKFQSTESTLQPLPNTFIKVVSTENQSTEGLGPYEKGELLVKGPQLMKGYHMCSNQAEGFLSDGWLKTGDLGYYDKNGFFSICDRIKDVIKVNGFQVVPSELENILRNHDSIVDAVVIGIPDKKYGEVPLAFVVPELSRKINVADVKQYVSRNVVHYKQLKGGIIVLDDFPKNELGKVLRKELKRKYQSSDLQSQQKYSVPINSGVTKDEAPIVSV
ncbi:hypothetical protein FQA39_LY02030 [Lamprigera yunnana]|nr:hypothetical protein FQA39_LY02030 [Lamprigera yunnana]